jgi:hypothetical protein
MNRPAYRTTAAAAAVALAALALAWRPGAALGTGMALGGVGGAGVSLLGVLWQRHWLARDPRRAMRAQVEAFLAKLALLAGGTAALASVPVLNERADWRAFALCFVAASVAVLFVGVFELHPLGREPRSPGQAREAQGLRIGRGGAA